MKHSCPSQKIRLLALLLIAIGLLILLLCVPFWVFAAALATVLILLGIKLFL